MLRSMTGFGAGRATVESEEIAVEIRSVNHKFCEIKVRSSRELATLEPLVLKLVKERVARGAIDVSLKRASRTAGGLVPTVDVHLAREYRRAFSELAAAIGVPDEIALRDVALQPNVIRLDEPEVSLDSAARAVEQALGTAIDALTAMRVKEGVALGADLSHRLALVATLVGEVRAIAPKTVDEYKKRLEERIAELARTGTVDPQRIAQEVAFFADRTDVAEEMTRLASHLDQFRALIASGEPAGRKMDFLVQEMHREVNTTGSKSQHPELSHRVVQLKAELERIREQVQNIE